MKERGKKGIKVRDEDGVEGGEKEKEERGELGGSGRFTFDFKGDVSSSTRDVVTRP